MRHGQCCGTTCCETEECSAPRNFLTKEEKLEMLSEYKESLEREIKAVSEKISEIKKRE